jgi:chromosomal replication initiator protein
MPSDQTFDTFVRHWTNDYAYGVARHLVSRSCTNPFIIFRGRECGKTHLLSAIAHELRRQELSITIVHTSKAWINCLPRSRVDKAVEELRDAEVILIDGIDEIDMFDSSLQPYVSCLLDRIESGCTVIGTIQDSPVGVRDTADTRLVSTIAQAIICSIQSPNNELRALIVRQRLQTLGCNGVDEPVIDFLANHVSAAHSIREVMGATNTVAARFGAELKHCAN